MTLPGRMLAQNPLEVLRALLGAANAPAIRQSAREILEHEVPGFGGPLALNATRETVPGLGTGQLANALLNGPEDVRQAYSQVAGDVPTWQALGRKTQSTLPGTGSFRVSETAPWETNPLSVNRPIMETTYTKPNRYSKTPGNELTLKSGEIPLAEKLEALAGMADVQNVSAAHVMLPGGGSGFSAFHRGTTPDEMRALLNTMEPQGFSPVDTGRGVSLMNFGGSQADLMAKLPQLNDQMQQMLPGASAILPSHFDKSGVYNDFTRALTESNQGNSTASNQLVKMLTGTKDKGKALIGQLNKSDELAQSFLDRNARDAEYASLLGVKNRKDVMLFRKIIGEDGFKEFVKAVQQGKIALPAATVMVKQAVDQYGGNEGLDTNE